MGGDLTELLERAQPDVVLNAVVGFAGLPATLWALEAGVDLALANKESLVAAGELALAAQERGGGLLLPVDSEHSASFQCLEGRGPRVRPLARAHGVRRAVSRPIRRGARRRDAGVRRSPIPRGTWARRSPIDSATLANKGLELIEAHFLFGLPYDRLEVVVHPTSIVHAHRALPRRRARLRISATRTCASRSRTRSRTRSGRHRGATPRSDSAHARVPCARPRGIPAARRSRVRRGSAAGRRRASSTPRTRSPSRRSSRSASGLPISRRSWPQLLETLDLSPARDVEELTAADAQTRSFAEGALSRA